MNKTDIVGVLLLVAGFGFVVLVSWLILIDAVAPGQIISVALVSFAVGTLACVLLLGNQ